MNSETGNESIEDTFTNLIGKALAYRYLWVTSFVVKID